MIDLEQWKRPSFAVVLTVAAIAVFMLIQSRLGYTLPIAGLGIALVFIFFAAFPRAIPPLLVVITLVDLTPGRIGGISDLLLREILTPITFVAYLMRDHRSIKRLEQYVRENPISLFNFFFLGVLVLNFIFRPALPANLLGISTDVGGFRAYLGGVISSLSLFLSFWILSDYPNIAKPMDRVLAITALFFVVIGFATWIVGYPIALPLLPQTSQYWVGVDYGSLYGGIAFRIGQLQTFGPLLVLWALAKIPKGFFGRILRIAIVSLGLLAAFLSGGRSNFVGLMLTLPVYAVLLARRRIWTEMLWLSGILGIGIIVIQSTLPGQFERITTAFLSFEQQDPYRTILFDIYWQGFEDSPIFGQGIGSKTEVLGYAATSALGDAEFFSQQIITGGHGSYLSILFVFGLLGAIPWFGLLTTALIASFRLARDRAEEDSVPGFWSRLTFLYLISILPAFAVGGNGYDAAWTYLVMGIVAALVTRRNSIVESGQPG